MSTQVVVSIVFIGSLIRVVFPVVILVLLVLKVVVFVRVIVV